MIRDIIQPLEGNISQYMQEQNGLSHTQATEAIMLAQDTIMHSLRRETMQDNSSGLLGLFSEPETGTIHPLETIIREEYTDQLASRMQLPAGTALQIGRYAIPAILNALRKYVTTNGTADRGKIHDVIAGDFDTLRESLEKGLNAEHAGNLKDKLSEIFGFGIGGKY